MGDCSLEHFLNWGKRVVDALTPATLSTALAVR